LIQMADEGYTLSEQVDRYTTILLGYIDQSRFDLYIKGSTRLQISVTDITNIIPINRIVTKFKDLTHLEETIRASACIPILLDDQIRKIENRMYLDGGLTNNLPALDQNTIRLSCLNFPTLQAEVHPEQFLSIRTCFVHPGERVVLRMMEEGYVDFVKFMNPYIEKKRMEELDAEIQELEKEFTTS
jgi:Patatin-like phospholipase